jgi:uncharacterized protein YeaO (DUF488 family)
MIKLEIKIKRIYEEPSSDDGSRILVDRLWPRGVSKQQAKIDQWFKDIAPSQELREWYGHDPEKFPEFRKKYREEIISGEAFTELLIVLETQTKVTLVFAAKDVELSNAWVLSELVKEHINC